MGRYVSRLVVDANGVPLPNAIGQIFNITDVNNVTPLPLSDVGGTPYALNQLIANEDGITPEFTTVGNPRVKWVSGEYELDMLAWDTIPEGGIAGQVLAKVTDGDFDLDWQSPLGVPTGGVEGQILVKEGSTPFATRWDTLPEGGGGTGDPGLAENGVAHVRQNLTTGAWPVRPTASANILVIWIGVDSWPAVVASGVNGPHAGDLLHEIKP